MATGIGSGYRVRVLVLVLDSATPAITAALVRIDVVADVVAGRVELVAQRRVVDARAHGELLAPEIGEVLQAGGTGPRELAAIVAGVGPGPFTGLRVGLVTAKAMSHALGIPTYGVCSLDAIGAAATAEPAPVLVATDARRREVYWALYSGGRRVEGPAVAVPAEVAARAAQAGIRKAYGDGAHRYAEALGREAVEVVDEPRYPPADALAALAADRVRGGAPSEPLTPLYLRRPDATPAAERKPVLQ
jgi:tRNA threonylcarbamoyl adenosine modification protein YeaZ